MPAQEETLKYIAEMLEQLAQMLSQEDPLQAELRTVAASTLQRLQDLKSSSAE